MSIPTKFEREVRRSLDILVKNFRAQVPDNNGAKDVELEIYLNDVDPKDPENVHPFVFCDTVRSFKNEGVKINEYDRDGVLSDSMKYGKEHTPFCSVTVPANFEKIYKKLVNEIGGNKSGTTAPTREPLRQKLLHKDGGDYFYDGKKINMSANTIYYRVLDALYSNSGQDGFLSYKEIDNFLIAKGEEEVESDEERNKRIQNAVSNQLFRFAKIGKKSFENKTLNGGKLIDIVRGDGLKINNPYV